MKKILQAIRAVFCIVPMLLCLGMLSQTQVKTITPKAVLANVKATNSTHRVEVNGTSANPQAYNIAGYNYFKLRDIAYLLQGTQNRFELQWDAKSQTINIVTEEQYTSVGGEMSKDSSKAIKMNATTAIITLNGESASVSGYNINGNNYYKIADLAKTVDFAVSFDAKTKTVQITSKEIDIEELVIEPRTSHLDGKLTIMIDAGHGGGDIGAKNETYDIDEKHINLYVAQYLQEMLEDSDATVIMVRTTLEEGENLRYRGELMEQYKDSLDLFFSIHHNAANTTAKGAQVLAQVQDKAGGPTSELADELAKEYAKVGLTLRNTWFREGDNGDYYYTNREAAKLQIPAVVSEYCFIDNDEDVQFVMNEEGWKREAQAQYNAIMAYFSTHEY